MKEETSVSIETADGAVLSGTLFEGSGSGPVILVSSAAAVERRFYTPFARHLLESGASRVLTYDYRGVGGSAAAADRSSRMKEWGTLDMPGAAAFLQAQAPGTPLVGVGHSFGGLAIGLSGISSAFARYAMVASLNGYFVRTAEPLSVFTRMNVVGVPITYLLGRLPGRVGLGTTLPGPIFRDWARWCRKPNFFFGDPAVPEAARFADVRLPLLSVSVADDRWGTPRAISALLKHFPAADLSELVVEPKDGRAIGHTGYFRREQAPHWQVLADFLLKGRMPASATAGRRRRAA